MTRWCEDRHRTARFDNVYYEICNEPYRATLYATAEWQAHISGTIWATNPRALIAQNIANGSTKSTARTRSWGCSISTTRVRPTPWR